VHLVRSIYLVLGIVFLLFQANTLFAADLARGVQLYENKDFSGAERELSAVVDSQPGNLRARYYLGLSLLELERHAEAEQVFTELESAQGEGAPGPAQVKVGLARAQMEQKQYDRAQSNLDQALNLAPKDPEVYLYRGKLGIHRENYPAAAKELDRAIELAPKTAYAHYYAGIAYSNLRRPDKMVDHFQYFLKLAPDAPEANKVKSLLRSVR